MARSLEGVLAGIPGYAGYLAKRQYNEQEDSNELRQASGLMQIVQAAQKQQQERAYRQAVQSLPADATEEQILAVTRPHMGADQLGRMITSSRDRQATLDAANVNKDAALTQARELATARLDEARRASEQKITELQMRLASAETTAADRQAAAREIAQIRADSAREIAGLRLEVAGAGRVPAGYRMKPDGTMEAIKGGPADVKVQGQFNQDTASLSGLTANLDRLSTMANEVMNHRGLSGITGVTGAFPDIPGSAAADARAKLESLRAQVGFGVLQDMRNNSKTGGALGQISDRENILLQNALDALATSQSEEQIKKSLANIIKYTEGAKDRLRGAYNMKHGDRAASPTPPAPEQPKNDWLERAIKANPNMPRDQVIAEGKRLKKLPEDFR